MKLVYPACFYKEDSGYSVVVPDLLGCCTQGDTLEDAIQINFSKTLQDALINKIVKTN